MLSTGALQNSGMNTSAAQNSSGSFNSKLISGLKPGGNGIVVKVSAGVESIKVRSMRAPSNNSTNLAKAEPTRITFSNTNKDNFITLRMDKNGNLKATVVEDNQAKSELGSKLKTPQTKIGIISGQNKLFNEGAGMRIRESINGKFGATDLRFLSAVKLTNISTQLSEIFKKFRSMTDETSRKKRHLLWKFNMVNRRQQDSDQGQSDDDDHQNNNKGTSKSNAPASVKKLNTGLTKSAYQKELIVNAIRDAKAKMSEYEEELKALKKKKRPKRATKKRIKDINENLTSYQRGLDILVKKQLSKTEELEQQRLFVSILMDGKKELFQEFNQITQNRTRLVSSANPKSQDEKKTFEQCLLHYDSAREQVQIRIRLINDLIRDYGGHQVLSKQV